MQVPSAWTEFVPANSQHFSLIFYDHPVYGAGIWTHDLQNMSLLP